MPEGFEPLNEGEQLDEDERHLASLGYTQELSRSWSGFSNFAISFSIISILAGCFTSFGLGWNNGGPAAIASRSVARETPSSSARSRSGGRAVPSG